MLARIAPTLGCFSARLSRFIVAWVFASIVGIEIIILIPSYLRQEQTLLDKLEGVSQEVLIPMLTNSMYQNLSSQTIISKMQGRLKQDSVILGGALYQPNGKLLGTFGQTPDLAYRPPANNRQRQFSNGHYDVLWPATALNGQYVLVVRHDAASVQSDLLEFIGRIAGLVLIIAIFVTLATMLTLGVTVIVPILRLRDDLLAAGEAISTDQADPTFRTLSVRRQDELGEVFLAFRQMFHRVRQEIQERRAAEAELRSEQEKSERLLLNILPAPIAEQLKQNPVAIADRFDQVTILFADIVDFTGLAARMPPAELVNRLNQIFSAFDQLAEQYNLEKIKTIGDAYMVVGGLPTPCPGHAKAIAQMALDMRETMQHFQTDQGEPLQIRIGIHSGPVVAGVIGLRKFIYDLWGDTVNLASRMESQGVIGEIQVTDAVYKQLEPEFWFEPRGLISIKGRGDMMTYFLKGVRSR